MKVIEEGQRYEAHTANGVPVFDIIFCKLENGEFVDGITNEELVEILIDRMVFLVKKKPSQENINTLTHLRQVKQWMNVRNFKKLNNNRNNDSRGNGLHFQAKSRQAG